MPIKLLPHLRLLNPSFSITRFSCSMNLQPSIKSVPTVCRVFPYKLKYLGLSRLHQQPQLPGVRKLSTRPYSRSELGRERGSREVRASKSLIEDEAELSDWVSELGSDSQRKRNRFKDDDEEVSDFKTARGGRGRDRERESFPMKRRRENGSDEFRDSRGRLNRKPANSNSNSVSRFGRRFDGEPRGNEGSLQKRSRGERGNVDSFRDMRKERGGFMKDGMKLRREAQFSEDDEEEEDDDDELATQKGFRDLLVEDDSDVDDDSDDDLPLERNARESIGLDKGNGEMSVKRSSPGKGDSYLSESRCALQKLLCFGFCFFCCTDYVGFWMSADLINVRYLLYP